MAEGDKVTVLPSVALSAMRLGMLAGRAGTVVAVGASGCWVALDGAPVYGEAEWFVPRISISEL